MRANVQIGDLVRLKGETKWATVTGLGDKSEVAGGVPSHLITFAWVDTTGGLRVANSLPAALFVRRWGFVPCPVNFGA